MSKRLLLGTAFAALASPAFADLNADTLWDDLVAWQAATGATTTVGSQTYVGGVLRLSDVTIQSSIDGTSSVVRIDRITLTEVNAETVELTLSPVVPITVSDASGGTTSVVTLQMRLPDQLTRITEDGTSLDILSRGASASVEVLDIVEDGQNVPMDMRIELSGYTSTTTLTQGTPRSDFASDLVMDALSLKIDIEEGADAATVDYTVNGITSTSTGGYNTTGPGITQSLSALGLNLLTGYDFTSGRFAMSGTDAGATFAIDGTSGGGDLSLTLTPEAIRYSGGSNDLVFNAQVPDFPLPISGEMARYGFGFAMPLAPTDNGAFALSVALQDLEINDALWGMFDPSGQLPRTPATVSFDLEGTTKVLVDLLGDPATVEAVDIPFEPQTLELSNLRVALAGAELTGSGSGGFNNQMLAFGGPPIPFGTVNLRLTGGFALIDKLSAAGLLPPGEAAGVKAMVGVIARPTGDDQLESEIEFTREGGIIANGLQLQ